uniref:Uncharacterized protein n=1 Tax=Octopus bimaculoides TaxID=37653 RepID=A0A0L8H435_OCTBM
MMIVIMIMIMMMMMMMTRSLKEEKIIITGSDSLVCGAAILPVKFLPAYGSLIHVFF